MVFDIDLLFVQSDSLYISIYKLCRTFISVLLCYTVSYKVFILNVVYTFCFSLPKRQQMFSCPDIKGFHTVYPLKIL